MRNRRHMEELLHMAVVTVVLQIPNNKHMAETNKILHTAVLVHTLNLLQVILLTLNTHKEANQHMVHKDLKLIPILLHHKTSTLHLLKEAIPAALNTMETFHPITI
jgi:hypothetical protein